MRRAENKKIVAFLEELSALLDSQIRGLLDPKKT